MRDLCMHCHNKDPVNGGAGRSCSWVQLTNYSHTRDTPDHDVRLPDLLFPVRSLLCAPSGIGRRSRLQVNMAVNLSQEPESGVSVWDVIYDQRLLTAAACLS